MIDSSVTVPFDIATASVVPAIRQQSSSKRSTIRPWTRRPPRRTSRTSASASGPITGFATAISRSGAGVIQPVDSSARRLGCTALGAGAGALNRRRSSQVERSIAQLSCTGRTFESALGLTYWTGTSTGR